MNENELKCKNAANENNLKRLCCTDNNHFNCPPGSDFPLRDENAHFSNELRVRLVLKEASNEDVVLKSIEKGRIITAILHVRCGK